MLKSSGAMGIATLTSRFLGLAREIVYGWFMGTSAVAGAFVFAFTIPNLFRRLFGEGVLSAPLFRFSKQRKKRRRSRSVAGFQRRHVRSCRRCDNYFVIAVAVVTIIMLFFSHHFDPDALLMFEPAADHVPVYDPGLLGRSHDGNPQRARHSSSSPHSARPA